MGQAIPQQHPAVVLRSHYRAVRALLAVAMVAVVGLSGAVVIVANDDDAASAPSKAALQFQESPATHAHPKENLAATEGPGPAQDESLRHPGFRTD